MKLNSPEMIFVVWIAIVCVGIIVVGFSVNRFIAKRNADLKKCRFCAEPIQREAVVCRYCGRELV